MRRALVGVLLATLAGCVAFLPADERADTGVSTDATIDATAMDDTGLDAVIDAFPDDDTAGGVDTATEAAITNETPAVVDVPVVASDVPRDVPLGMDVRRDVPPGVDAPRDVPVDAPTDLGPCGMPREPCCAGSNCNAGMACSGGLCLACGGAGQPCCATNPQCTLPGNRGFCDNSTRCQFCGLVGQFCCPSGGACTSTESVCGGVDRCVACGNRTQPCCAGRRCNGALTCGTTDLCGP